MGVKKAGLDRRIQPLLFQEVNMSFSFYMVDAAYCDYLRKSDPCVPYTMEQKAIRPFVGIVFSVSNTHYYAPLTSPKPKHLRMKSQIDFLKIKGGEWGAILKQAEKLYRLIVDGKAWDTLASRCCSFSLDEALCAAYALEKFSDCRC